MRYALTLLALALTACAAPQTLVPESLLIPCDRPEVDVRTNAGLTQGLLAYDAVLQACNDDKAAIRLHLKGNQP